MPAIGAHPNRRRTHRLDRGDGVLAYVEVGARSGVPVLLLHGGRSSAAYWADLAERLRASALLIALDQRGHGDSDRFADYIWTSYLADVEALLIAAGVAPAIVVGHSMGGWLGYLLAARRPDLVRRVAVLDAGPMEPSGSPSPPPSFADAAALRGYLAAQLAVPAAQRIEAWLGRDFAPRTDGGYGWRCDPRLLEPATTRAMLPPTDEQWRALAALRCPVLLLMGGQGFGSRREVVGRMTMTIPDCRRVTIPDAGHYVATDAADKVAAELEEFCHAG